MANLITRMARTELFVGAPPPGDTHDLLVSCHGVGGTAYWGLRRGTTAYANGLAQATAGRDIARTLGVTYVVRAVTPVHGESDYVAGNLRYDEDLLEWQADYERDVRAITGQTEPIPMFQTQVSSWTRYGQATSPIPALQLAASRRRPEQLVLVGPKYNLSYVSDGVHLDNRGYRWMGQYYAKAYRRVVLEGRPWRPVQPARVSPAARNTIVFDVPARRWCSTRSWSPTRATSASSSGTTAATRRRSSRSPSRGRTR